MPSNQEKKGWRAGLRQVSLKHTALLVILRFGYVQLVSLLFLL